MGPLAKTSVSLRVFGNPLDPAEITRLLGKPPTKAYATGEALPSGFVPPHGSWRLHSFDGNDLDRQVAALLEQLTDDLSVWHDLVARFSVDLFCGLFMDDANEGLSLRAETLAVIGARRLTVALDLYAPEDERA
jgi:hypothetical protein